MSEAAQDGRPRVDPKSGTAGELALRREAIHADHASSRPLSENYELVGLRGEEEFMRLTGLPMDVLDRPNGDSGADFAVSLTVDVKTARKPYNLIVEQGKVVATIYVLAGYQDADDRVTFYGWAWRNEVLSAPAKDFGYGVTNHYIPRERLRKVEPLVRFLRSIGT